MPQKFTVISKLNTSQLDLIGAWLSSFPFEKDIDGETLTFEIDNNDLMFIINSKHGGGNAAYTFFQILKIRRGNKEIRYLTKILSKEREHFNKALDILERNYKEDDSISSLSYQHVSDLAVATTIIDQPVGNALLDWKYIAGKAQLNDIVDACKATRKNPGIDGSADAMFSIVQQRFADNYQINDFLKAFEKKNCKQFVDMVEKFIREEAEEIVDERAEEAEKRKKKNGNATLIITDTRLTLCST